MALNLVWRGDNLDDAARERRDRRRFASIAELDDCKFIAAEPRHRVARAETATEAGSDLDQKLIANRMAERIVDPLEMVEVETEDGELVVALGEFQRALELFAEQCAIRQAGERIVARHVRNLRLGSLPLRDILEGRDPAAAFRRLSDDPHRPPALLQHSGRAPAGLRIRNQP